MKIEKKVKILSAKALLFLMLPFFLSACGDELENISTEQLMEYAYSTAEEGRWDAALQYSQRAYAQRPDDTSVRLMHALALENNDRKNDALEICRLAAGDEKSFLAQYSYGRMLFQSKKYEQAENYLNRALALKADDFKTLLLLQQTLAQMNKNRANENLCKKLLMLSKDKNNADLTAYVYNELILNVLAGRKHNLSRNNINAISSAFGLVTRLKPTSPEMEWNRAIFYDFYLGNTNAAKMHYERFLQLTEKYSGMEKERAAVNARLYKTESK